MYVYMWEYIVAPDQATAFEDTYGSSGEWTHLFRRAPGYVRTELLRDRTRSERYVTIDYWESEKAWEAFRSRFSGDFDTLDSRCEKWTRRETEIGRFEALDGSG